MESHFKEVVIRVIEPQSATGAAHHTRFEIRDEIADAMKKNDIKVIGTSAATPKLVIECDEYLRRELAKVFSGLATVRDATKKPVVVSVDEDVAKAEGSTQAAIVDKILRAGKELGGDEFFILSPADIGSHTAHVLCCDEVKGDLKAMFPKANIEDHQPPAHHPGPHRHHVTTPATNKRH